jgi:dTDP-4-dehydrorhamnose reductase
MVVLVTGASGQLGQALQFLAGNYPDIDFHFANSSQADITDKKQLKQLFTQIQPVYCVNAAAYTAVDKAESEPEKAHAINVIGARNIAEICRDFHTTLLHVSTDFVFDGQQKTPYTENDTTSPQGVYGITKRQGEEAIVAVLKEHFIIRTSWLYSRFGNNFMKTMLKFGNERPSMNVVDDQMGTPTHAVDLAKALLTIIQSGKKAYGIYHFSNEGTTSWYGFAKSIFEINKINIELNPIPTSAYPTPAKRPEYSVLDKSKIKETFGIEIMDWEESLKKV